MAKLNKFGTFGGVFTPSILTILGVIMYLRLPMIVGEAGLWSTLGIIIVAHVISLSTGLSVSSIATDKKVQAGGTYYMISRSLGLPIGGTLGLALFVGLSFSVSLYLIGFSESFLSYWEFDITKDSIRVTGSIVLLAVTIITFISTSLAIKTQYIIMAAIAVSLISILFGNHDFSPDNVGAAFSSTVPIMVLFGIFFPAVTGFEAGVSMSGDLKDPKKSIPSGSITAILVGLIVYIALAFFFYLSVDRSVLATDANVLLKISWIPELVVAGIWGATLSSALGSILGAPRILQATAVDKITPKFFAKGYGPSKEPRNALLLTFFIAWIGILIGELDVIARVVSIFFITTYGFLNLSCAFESWTSADFRPEFKIPVWISIVGALASLLVMIQLDFVAMVAATIILGFILTYLKRRELRLESGDAWSGIWASLVKQGIEKLSKEKLHQRNWRPNIILFSGDIEARPHLLELGKAIAGQLGILSSFELIPVSSKYLKKPLTDYESNSKTSGVFFHKHECYEVFGGMEEIARIYGFSGIDPNTILMGWSRQQANKEKFLELMIDLKRKNFNTIYLDYDSKRQYGQHHSIDIWWNGYGKNLSFLLNVLRHLTATKEWTGAELRLLMINYQNDQLERIYNNMKAVCADYRIEMEIKIINNQLDLIPEKQIISNESNNADLILLSIPDGEYHDLAALYDDYNEILNDIGSTILLHASRDFEDLSVMGIQEAKPAGKGIEYLEEEIRIDLVQPSNFPEITSDIELIRINSEKVLNILWNKVFHNVHSYQDQYLNEMYDILSKTIADLKSIGQVKEKARISRLNEKARNDLYFKAKVLFQKIQEFQEQEKLGLLSGLSWYQEQLKSDLQRFPGDLSINISKEKINSSVAGASLSSFYRITHKSLALFTGYPIKHKVPYRKQAIHFQYNSRIFFLDALLQEMEKDTYHYYLTLRRIFKTFLETISNIKDSIDEKGLIYLEKILVEIKDQMEHNHSVSNRYKSRLSAEMSKNLEQFSHILDPFQRKTINPRYLVISKKVKEINNRIDQFAEEHFNLSRTLLNKFEMTVWIEMIKSRTNEKINDFNSFLQMEIGNNFHKPIKQAESIISQAGSDLKKLSKIEFTISSNLLSDTFNKYYADIISLISQAPESLLIFTSINEKEQFRETSEVPVRRMIEHYIESRFYIQNEDNLADLETSLAVSARRLQDIVSLAVFNLENLKYKDPSGVSSVEIEMIFSDCKKHLDLEKEKVNLLIEQYTNACDQALHQSFSPLSLLSITETARAFTHDVRSYQGSRVMGTVDVLYNKWKSFYRKLITRYFYGKSEGLLFAKKLSGEQVSTSLTARLIATREKIVPDPFIIKNLPQYYYNLFTGKSSIGEEYWIERSSEEKIAWQAYHRYLSGYHGGILCLGDRNSGKTSFSKYIANRFSKSKNVYSVFPPLGGSCKEEDFLQSLRASTGLSGDAHIIFSQLPPRSILLFNDLELWWEKSENGYAIIGLIKDLLNQYSNNHLFLVNSNPYAYKMINQLFKLDQYFIETINAYPFDAEELESLIMIRHRSSGLRVSLEGSDKDISDIQQANLFNSYFDFSKGNPGVAQNGWLASIVQITNNRIYVKKPEKPSLSPFKEIDIDWALILWNLILHKRARIDKLNRTSGLDEKTIMENLLALQRAGLIMEKSPGIYMADSYMYPFIVQSLKDMNLL